MKTNMMKNGVVGFLAVAILALTTSGAMAATTSGSGKWTSGSGDLPTIVKPNTDYSVPLTVKAKANGWPCTVNAKLKLQCGIYTVTVIDKKITISASQTSVVLNNYLRSSGYIAWTPGLKGTMWWEVATTMNSPTIVKLSDSFSTSKVTFTITK